MTNMINNGCCSRGKKRCCFKTYEQDDHEPVVGLLRSAIVRDNKNNKQYIYDALGVYTLIDGGVSDEELNEKLAELDAKKQDSLTAGDGIDITDNVISATGGGAITILRSMDDVDSWASSAENGAIATYIEPKGIKLWEQAIFETDDPDLAEQVALTTLYLDADTQEIYYMDNSRGRKETFWVANRGYVGFSPEVMMALADLAGSGATVASGVDEHFGFYKANLSDGSEVPIYDVPEGATIYDISLNSSFTPYWTDFPTDGTTQYMWMASDGVAYQLHVDGSVADGSITTAKLANNAVTTSKIENYAVTGSKIADRSISPSHIVDLFTSHIGAIVTSVNITGGTVIGTTDTTLATINIDPYYGYLVIAHVTVTTDSKITETDRSWGLRIKKGTTGTTYLGGSMATLVPMGNYEPVSEINLIKFIEPDSGVSSISLSAYASQLSGSNKVKVMATSNNSTAWFQVIAFGRH